MSAPNSFESNAFVPVPIQLPAILHGGDYNPEQWPESVWLEDWRLMQAANVNIATLPVFGWVSLQPDENTFTFEWLDRVIDGLWQHGVHVCLATATGSVPAWLTQQYPDVLVTDDRGIRRRHGGRHTFCPTSPDFRRLSTALARRLAERYKDHPAILLWHISNEYGGNGTGGHCFCDRCCALFRDWLKQKYGDLETLNERWYTRFWGHTYTDWNQVEPPFAHGEAMTHQAMRLDWNRCQDQMLRECFVGERDAIRAITPHLPITTNLMGAFFPLNYRAWAKEMDIVSWDNYPRPNDPPGSVAFSHALMRGLREGQPFLLMEQSPSQQNWQPYNWLKTPGLLRLQSFQAVAQGADSVMYFQWRRGKGGIEKLHGAVVEHHGREDARVFREVSEIGADLARLGTKTLGGRIDARVAILWDWENWWSLRFSSGPSRDFDYPEECRAIYSALWELGVQTEVVAPDADLSAYQLIIAPSLTMLRTADASRIETRVAEGAILLATVFTGLVDENDLVHDGGAPGPLRKTLGLWVEETDALEPGRDNGLRFSKSLGSLTENATLGGGRLCDRVRLETAQAVAVYTHDFYAGEPALTVNQFGQGRAYYLATRPSGEDLKRLLGALCTEIGIHSPLGRGALPAGVEVSSRVSPESGEALLYLLNHAPEPVSVPLQAGVSYTDLLTDQPITDVAELGVRGVRILARAIDRNQP